jgi:hypothetical protein
MSAYSGYAPSQYLFDRDWSVLLVPQVQTGADSFGNPIYSQIASQGQLFAKAQANQVGTATNGANTNLRVTFDINKTAEGQSNKGKLEIWNLNPTSRKALQKGAQVTLSAGYVNLMKRILLADVIASDITVERREQDIVTTFAVGENERQIETAIIFKNYPAGTLFSAIINDCADVLGVSLSTIIGIDDFTYNQPLSFTHTVKDALQYLTTSNNLEWHIQDDELFILPVGGSFTSQAIVLSSGLDETGQTVDNTGLIGIPSFAENGMAKYSCLLNPDVYPGQLIQLISENVNGFFVVRNAHYKGDSHGNDWQIDCESYPDDKVNAQQITQNDILNQAFNASA